MNPRIKKFASYYKPYLGLFVLDMACAFAVSAITLALPLITRFITGDLLAGGDPDVPKKIMLIGAAMLLMVIIHTACSIFIDYQGHTMGALMERDMRNELFEHYQKLPHSFYDENKIGQLMTRITSDLLSLTELYHHGPEDITVSLIKFVGTFVILMTINVKLTLIIFAFMPVMIVYALFFSKKVNAALRQSKDRVGDINAQVEDSLAGIRVVKSFANEAAETRKFAFANNAFLRSRKSGYKSEAYCYTGLGAFTQLITVAVVIFGGLSIARQALSLSDLLTYLLCVSILIDPIMKLVNFVRLYQEGITAFDRFMEVMEVEPEIRDSAGAVELKSTKGGIEFQRVSFRYKEDYGYVLKDLNLQIRAGETVALVGLSGVGKTTLCSLIPRFYEATDGCILLDGRDIRDFTQQSLRKNIGVVQQDLYMFAGTVAQNITYGKPDASREEIIEAAKKADAHDFILGLPNGYDTDIGQRGVKLSGGQKQRLSIARVFLKDPPILILDEATSNLDNESERAIRQSLEKLAANRTTLIIAHRLSTVRNADRILVLTENGIGEQGCHEELMVKNGLYAELYQMQLSI